LAFRGIFDTSDAESDAYTHSQAYAAQGDLVEGSGVLDKLDEHCSK